MRSHGCGVKLGMLGSHTFALGTYEDGGEKLTEAACKATGHTGITTGTQLAWEKILGGLAQTDRCVLISKMVVRSPAISVGRFPTITNEGLQDVSKTIRAPATSFTEMPRALMSSVMLVGGDEALSGGVDCGWLGS